MDVVVCDDDDDDDSDGEATATDLLTDWLSLGAGRRVLPSHPPQPGANRHCDARCPGPELESAIPVRGFAKRGPREGQPTRLGGQGSHLSGP